MQQNAKALQRCRLAAAALPSKKPALDLSSEGWDSCPIFRWQLPLCPRWSSAIWVQVSDLQRSSHRVALWMSQACWKGWDGAFFSRSNTNPGLEVLSIAPSSPAVSGVLWFGVSRLLQGRDGLGWKLESLGWRWVNRDDVQEGWSARHEVGLSWIWDRAYQGTERRVRPALSNAFLIPVSVVILFMSLVWSHPKILLTSSLLPLKP